MKKQSATVKAEDMKGKLSPEQYEVLCESATEPAFSGKFLLNKKKGVYVCAACGNGLFSSNAKFESGTGWPSFYQPVSEGSVKEKADYSLIVPRTEVVCGKCGGHLGHVFPDGPNPTGMRYCINSLALDFDEVKEALKKHEARKGNAGKAKH